MQDSPGHGIRDGSHCGTQIALVSDCCAAAAVSRTAAPRTGEARVVVGRPGDGADTGDEMRSASEWRQVYNNDTNPSFGGGARPPPSAWEKFFFMGGWLFYYTNPSFCEAISTPRCAE